MKKTSKTLIKQCCSLRKRGFSLGEIVKATKLPKTTVFDQVKNIVLSPELKRKILEKQIKKTIERNKARKGKCWKGREITFPDGWSEDLLFLTSHFMFDGEIKYSRCVYHNRNSSLILAVESSMVQTFNFKPYKLFNDSTGVHRISYHHVPLAKYFKDKSRELTKYIRASTPVEKKIFLRSFFDDEGSIHFAKKIVRGFQHNLKLLELIQKLLEDLDIESKIDKKYQEIMISKKENLINFQRQINFSPGIFINPNRKNSIWKKKLEKRYILSEMINSYKN